MSNIFTTRWQQPDIATESTTSISPGRDTCEAALAYCLSRNRVWAGEHLWEWPVEYSTKLDKAGRVIADKEIREYRAEAGVPVFDERFDAYKRAARRAALRAGAPKMSKTEAAAHRKNGRSTKRSPRAATKMAKG